MYKPDKIAEMKPYLINVLASAPKGAITVETLADNLKYTLDGKIDDLHFEKPSNTGIHFSGKIRDNNVTGTISYGYRGGRPDVGVNLYFKEQRENDENVSKR